MRLRRVGQREIRQEHWESHEKVLIKGFTSADTQWVQDAAMLLKGDSVENAELRVLAGTSQLCTLIRGIVSWTLTDEMGIGLPWPVLFDSQGNIIQQNLEIRKKALATLMPDDAQFIYDEIGKLNQPMSKEEMESFLAPPTPGTVEIPPAHLQLLSTNS
jgi:hypothetical protein